MILQAIDPRSPIGGIVGFLRGLINPQGVAEEKVTGRAAEDPQFAQAIADSIRTAQFNERESLKQAQSFAQEFGDQRPQRGPDQILGPQTEGNVAQADSTFNPLAAIATTLGLNPDDPGTAKALFAIEAANPSTIEGDALNISRRGGGAQGIADLSRETVSAATTEQTNRGRQATEAGRIGAPEAIAQRTKAQAEQATQLEELAIALQTSNVEVVEGSLADYNRFLDANPQFRGLAGAAFTNPAFVQTLNEMARLDLQERIALLNRQARTSADAVKQTAALLSIGKDLRSGVADFVRLREAGADDQEEDALLAGLTAQTGIIHAGGLSQFFPDLIGVDGELITISPRLGKRPGGGDPESFPEARQFGIEENVIERTSLFLEQIALNPGEGREVVMRLLFDNPDEETQDFIRFMQDRGLFDQFVKDVRFNSIEGRAARAASPAARLGGLPTP